MKDENIFIRIISDFFELILIVILGVFALVTKIWQMIKGKDKMEMPPNVKYYNENQSEKNPGSNTQKRSWTRWFWIPFFVFLLYIYFNL